MHEDVFSSNCDFQFGGAQATHNVFWPGGRGLLCVPGGVAFFGNADIVVTAYGSADPLTGTVGIGFPPGISGPIAAPGNFVFDAPKGVLQFNVTLSAGGDRLQVGASIFVEKV